MDTQNPEITEDQIEKVVTLFRNELKKAIDEYNPYKNLATDINALFKAGQSATKKPLDTPAF